MLKQYVLGEEAFKWVGYSLRYGNTLADKLLALPLAEGCITSFLSGPVEETFLHEFERGGGTGHNQTRSWLLPFIESYPQNLADTWYLKQMKEGMRKL
jgi:hypothetical protein